MELKFRISSNRSKISNHINIIQDHFELSSCQQGCSLKEHVLHPKASKVVPEAPQQSGQTPWQTSCSGAYSTRDKWDQTSKRSSNYRLFFWGTSCSYLPDGETCEPNTLANATRKRNNPFERPKLGSARSKQHETPGF